MIPVGFNPGENDAMVAFLEKQVAYGREFSAAIGDVAYVLMSNGGSANVAVAERLRDTMAGWICSGMEEQIHRLKSRPPVPAFAVPWGPSVEQLAGLVRRRDGLQSQLDQYNDIREKISEAPGGEVLSQWMRTMEMPVTQQLEQLEDQISEMQKALETAGPEEESAGDYVPPAGGKAE